MKNRSAWIIAIVQVLMVFSNINAADYNLGIKSRYESGDEAYPYSSEMYPDNLVKREYFETLINFDLTFNQIKFGDRLRFNLRFIELQPSNVDSFDIDKRLFNLEDNRLLKVEEGIPFPDKISARLNYKRWEFWAGDVYETFGRGLALNLFENRDLFYDTGLRGGKVSYRSKKVRFKAVYGTSRDGYQVYEENIGGLNLELRPVRDLQVGASLVQQEGLYYTKQMIPEIYAGYEYYPFSIYAEYAQKRVEDFDLYAGEGLFTSFTAAVAGIAAQVNYKYYNFGEENPYVTPPICQREFTTKLLSSHPHIPHLNDQTGFEIDISATPHELVFLNLNFSRASKHEGSSLIPSLNEDYSPFWELFIEGEYYAREDLHTKFGFGLNEEAGPNFWQKKMGLLGEAIYNVNDLWSVTFLAENMQVEDINLDEEYSDNYFALTLGRAPYGTVTFSYENSTEETTDEGDEWLGVECALTIRTQHRLTFFYGEERGGLKCTSGVCRPVQPFEGFKIGYEGRF